MPKTSHHPTCKASAFNEVIAAVLQTCNSLIFPTSKGILTQKCQLNFFSKACGLRFVYELPILDDLVFAFFDKFGRRNFIAFLVIDFGVGGEEVP